MWVSDLFMRRVEAGDTWSFFDPSTCPGLNECWGDEYAALYERYEAEGLAVRQMPAQAVWSEILRSQVETGASKRYDEGSRALSRFSDFDLKPHSMYRHPVRAP